MALTLEEHDWPSVLASALRPSELHLLTSWDVLRGCPGCRARLGDKAFSSLSQPLRVRPCTAGAEPFPLPPCPDQSVPPPWQSSPWPLPGAHRDFRKNSPEPPLR